MLEKWMLRWSTNLAGEAHTDFNNMTASKANRFNGHLSHEECLHALQSVRKRAESYERNER